MSIISKSEVNRPTPETDAAEAKRRAEWLHKHKAHKDWIILSVSEVAVIRDELLILERERDEARGKCASWVREWRKLRVLCKQLDEDANDRLKERDEARELLASEKITRNHIIKRSVEVERERDEAREQNAKLLSIAERAIDDLRWFYESKADGVILELEQLKKETK